MYTFVSLSLSLSDDAAQLRKVSRTNPDSYEDVDGWVEGEREEREGERAGEGDRRVQDDSGITLPPISEEEGPLFSQSGSFLQPNRYTG